MKVYTVQFHLQVLLQQKELTQTNNNSLCCKARTIFTAYTVSHMFASLRACSILKILSFSFLFASSAYHADEFYG